MQQIQFAQSKNSLPRNAGVIFLIVDLGIFIVVQIGAENQQAAAHLEFRVEQASNEINA